MINRYNNKSGFKNVKGGLSRFLLSSVLSTSLFTVSSNAQVIGDFDGDLFSDISFVTKTSSTTSWLVRHNSGTVNSFAFTRPADALVQGHFYSGDIKTYPGIVTVSSATLPLNWYLMDSAKTENLVNFGMPGDIITNLGDLDCDGITDLATVREVGNDHVWQIRSSMGGNTLRTVSWGSKGYRPYTADLDGDGCSEIVTMNPETFIWYARHLGGSYRSIVQWGVPGDYPVVPQDTNGDGQADYIISRIEAGGQRVYIKTSETTNSNVLLPVASVSLPMAGRFLSAAQGATLAYLNRPGQALAFVELDNSFTNIAAGSSSIILVRPDGTVVQPDETGRIGFGASSCSRPKFPDGARRARLWKPVKEGGSHTKGGPTYLTPTQPARVEMFDKNGKKLSTKLRYRNGPGNRSTWDPTQKASAMAPRAPFILREIFSNGTCVDINIPDPRKRYD